MVQHFVRYPVYVDANINIIRLSYRSYDFFLYDNHATLGHNSYKST